MYYAWILPPPPDDCDSEVINNLDVSYIQHFKQSFKRWWESKKTTYYFIIRALIRLFTKCIPV
jgi:hypothetical protein